MKNVKENIFLIGIAIVSMFFISCEYEGIPYYVDYTKENTDKEYFNTVLTQSAFREACPDYETITEYTIPEKYTEIGTSTFDGCKALKKIVISNNIKSIGNSAFAYCMALEDVTIGNSVKSIYAYAFYGCTSIKNIIIPDSVTTIGSSSFYKCKALQNVIIGNGTTSIGDYAFYECKNLLQVTIGNGITSIGYAAFYNCSNLATVTIKATKPPLCGQYAFNYNATGRKIYVPASSLNDYKNDSDWSGYSNIVAYY